MKFFNFINHDFMLNKNNYINISKYLFIMVTKKNQFPKKTNFFGKKHPQSIRELSLSILKVISLYNNNL